MNYFLKNIYDTYFSDIIIHKQYFLVSGLKLFSLTPIKINIDMSGRRMRYFVETITDSSRHSIICEYYEIGKKQETIVNHYKITVEAFRDMISQKMLFDDIKDAKDMIQKHIEEQGESKMKEKHDLDYEPYFCDQMIQHFNLIPKRQNTRSLKDLEAILQTLESRGFKLDPDLREESPLISSLPWKLLQMGKSKHHKDDAYMNNLLIALQMKDYMKKLEELEDDKVKQEKEDKINASVCSYLGITDDDLKGVGKPIIRLSTFNPNYHWMDECVKRYKESVDRSVEHLRMEPIDFKIPNIYEDVRKFFPSPDYIPGKNAAKQMPLGENSTVLRFSNSEDNSEDCEIRVNVLKSRNGKGGNFMAKLENGNFDIVHTPDENDRDYSSPHKLRKQMDDDSNIEQISVKSDHFFIKHNEFRLMIRGYAIKAFYVYSIIKIAKDLYNVSLVYLNDKDGEENIFGTTETLVLTTGDILTLLPIKDRLYVKDYDEYKIYNLLPEKYSDVQKLFYYVNYLDTINNNIFSNDETYETLVNYRMNFFAIDKDKNLDSHLMYITYFGIDVHPDKPVTVYYKDYDITDPDHSDTLHVKSQDPKRMSINDFFNKYTIRFKDISSTKDYMNKYEFSYTKKGDGKFTFIKCDTLESFYRIREIYSTVCILDEKTNIPIILDFRKGRGIDDVFLNGEYLLPGEALEYVKNKIMLVYNFRSSNPLEFGSPLYGDECNKITDTYPIYKVSEHRFIHLLKHLFSYAKFEVRLHGFDEPYQYFIIESNGELWLEGDRILEDEAYEILNNAELFLEDFISRWSLLDESTTN